MRSKLLTGHGQNGALLCDLPQRGSGPLNMAVWRSKLWIWILLVTSPRGLAVTKPKLLGDEYLSDSEGNALMSRSKKQFLTDCPEPGDLADPFTVRTLDGEFSYAPGTLRGPLIIHTYTNRSGFLECLWTSESSLRSLVEDLPNSTQLLFLSLDDSALTDVTWMREQVRRVASTHRYRSHRFLPSKPALSTVTQTCLEDFFIFIFLQLTPCNLHLHDFARTVLHQ